MIIIAFEMSNILKSILDVKHLNIIFCNIKILREKKMNTENNSETRPLLDVERGAEVQQLTSNNRKCLQRPSKSCCVIIGILALFCTLVGVSIYAVYAGIVPGPADWFRNGLGLSKKFKFDGSSLKCMS